MNRKTTFIVNVIITWFMIVGGMCLAGWLSPSRTVYPVLIAACIVPAALFMKFRLPMSWHRFGSSIAIVTSLGLVLAILRKFDVGHDLTPLIAIGLVAFAAPLLNEKKKSRTTT